jgi:hypothetical protein
MLQNHVVSWRRMGSCEQTVSTPIGPIGGFPRWGKLPQPLHYGRAVWQAGIPWRAPERREAVYGRAPGARSAAQPP